MAGLVDGWCEPLAVVVPRHQSIKAVWERAMWLRNRVGDGVNGRGQRGCKE